MRPFRLDLARTTLLVVDMQDGLVSRGHRIDSLLRERFPDDREAYLGRLDEVVVPNAARLAGAFRSAGRPVLFLTVGSFRQDGHDFEPLRMAYDAEALADGRHNERTIASVGDPEHHIISALAPRAGEIILNKVTRSAFTSTGLDQILRNLQIEGVVVVGVATNACVGLTASDAADRGYKVVIVEDATGSIFPLLHEATLLNFAYLFGRVEKTADVLSELGLDQIAGPPGVRSRT